MKKILLSLFAMVMAITVGAQTVTFEAATDKSSSTEAAACSVEKDGITVATSQGVMGNGTEYRFYKSQTVTVTSAVGNIKSIEFTCTANGTVKYGPGCFTAATGTYEASAEKTGTWTGDAAEVVFTAATNQVRATKIVVTYESNGKTAVAAPKFSVAGGTYYAAQTVELTTSTADAAIYYSTNGTDFAAYTEALNIAETTTISAFSKKDETCSDTVEATYTIKSIETYNNLTDLIAACTATAQADAPQVILNVTDMVVTYVNGGNVFVTDGTKGFLIYGSKDGLKAGDKLSGTVQGELYKYNELPELAVSDSWANATVASSDNAVTPAEVAIAQITAGMATYQSALVKLQGVGFTADALTSKAVTIMDEDGDQITLYDKFGILAAYTWATTSAYIITGIPVMHGTDIQMYVTGIEVIQGAVADPTFNIASGTYNEDQTVEISSVEGTTVYYTLDGTNPTNASTEYTAAITVTETTTIKAIAYNAAGKKSNVVVLNVTIEKPYTTIAELNTNCTATSSSTAPTITYKFENLLVTGVKNSNVYVSDGEKAFLLYGSSSNLAKGDIISGTVTGKLYAFSGLNELAVSDKWANITKVSSGNAVNPVVTTIPEITANYKAMESQYIKLENVQFTATALSSKNITIKDADNNTIVVRDNFNILSSYAFNTDAVLNICAFVLNYNGTAQLYPIAVEDLVTGISNANVDANANGKFVKNGNIVIVKNGKQYNVNGQLMK